MPVKFVIKLIDWLIICSFMYTNTNANTNTAKWIMHPGDSIISYSPDWLASSPGTNLFWAFFALPLHSLRASWLSLVEHQNNSSHCWLFSPFFFVFPSFPLFSLVLFFFDFRLRRPRDTPAGKRHWPRRLQISALRPPFQTVPRFCITTPLAPLSGVALPKWQGPFHPHPHPHPHSQPARRLDWTASSSIQQQLHKVRKRASTTRIPS